MMVRQKLAAMRKTVRANQSLAVPVVVFGLIVNALWPPVLVAGAILMVTAIWR